MSERAGSFFWGSFMLQIPALFRVRQVAGAHEAAGLLHKAQYQRRLPDSGFGPPAAWEFSGNAPHSRRGDSLAGPWFRARKRDDRHARTARPNRVVLLSSSKTGIERRPIPGGGLRTTAMCARHTCPNNPCRHGATPFPGAKTPAARRDEAARLQPGIGGQCCRCSAEFRVQPVRHGASQQITPTARNGNDGSGIDRRDQLFPHLETIPRERTVLVRHIAREAGKRKESSRFPPAG